MPSLQDWPSLAVLDAALAYAKRGWAVLPVHSPNRNGCSCENPQCASAGKHPRTPHGVKDATTDSERIREWWARWPSAGAAVATGLVSGIAVLDVDGTEGEESLAALEKQHGKLARAQGASWRDIAARLGVGIGTVHRVAQGHLKKLPLAAPVSG